MREDDLFILPGLSSEKPARAAFPFDVGRIDERMLED
jgi:hypothetical protein